MNSVLSLLLFIDLSFNVLYSDKQNEFQFKIHCAIQYSPLSENAYGIKMNCAEWNSINGIKQIEHIDMKVKS